MERYVSSQGGWCIYFFLHLNNFSFITVCIDVVRAISRLYANAWYRCFGRLYKLEFAVVLGIGSQYACVQSQLVQVAIFCCEQTSLVVTTLRYECCCWGTSALLAVCKSFHNINLTWNSAHIQEPSLDIVVNFLQTSEVICSIQMHFLCLLLLCCWLTIMLLVISLVFQSSDLHYDASVHKEFRWTFFSYI